jgi:hypothetical protein
MLKLVPVFNSHFFAQKKGLHLMSHPCGCWRTGAIPADIMCNPIAINAAKRFANHNSKTICRAIVAKTTGLASHISTVLVIGVC